jgi:hypothetical protein
MWLASTSAFGQQQLTAPSLELLRLWCSESYGKNCEAYDLADPTRGLPGRNTPAAKRTTSDWYFPAV